MSDNGAFDLESYLPRFGLSQFRPGQREVIAALLAGEDCLCIMPTGGGKSLCYQLPAIVEAGLTLVVSPLIALMKDQVDQLQALGLRATFINSALDTAGQEERLEGMAAGRFDLVYVAPERFRSARFQRAIQHVGVRRLAIDEAHCISEWGHDFRPDYARLGDIRRRLGFPPTLALTATATELVRRDIMRQLDMREPRQFITGFARPNLHYEVLAPPSQDQKDTLLLEFIGQTPGAGIVYASTRKRCEEVAALIAAGTKRRVRAYHAGLMPHDREAAQNAFMQGEAEVIVATTAFGMGIDKADVRFVVHYNLPGTLEGYYQEAGRAGRDGLPSRCLLLYSAGDRYVQEFFIESAYPSREVVGQVYDFLRELDDDPIERTQEEIKEALRLTVGAEAVGTCEQLLEKAGVLERLDARQNMAVVRIDSELPTIVDLLPKSATVRRRVVQAVERIIGSRRGEPVYLHPQMLAQMTELDLQGVMRALRELRELQCFDYVPPFRGRAIRMFERSKPLDELGIDFAAYEERKKAEYAKLDAVLRFCRSRQCREALILTYFGESDSGDCGRCDSCRRAAPGNLAAGSSTSSGDVDHERLTEAIRKALSGVARANGRFGRMLIAQMLCGSKSSRMSQLRLDRLSTFGVLAEMKQTEVVELLETLVHTGHVEQVEIEVGERHLPVLGLTPAGERVMRGQQPWDGELPTWSSLGERFGKPGRAAAATEPVASATASGTPDRGLLEQLRQWRRERSEIERVPAYRILTNATLDALATERPTSYAALETIKGIGPATTRRYGEALLTMIRKATGTNAPSSAEAKREPAPAAPSDDPAIVKSEERDQKQRAPGDHTTESARPQSASAGTTDAEHPTHYWTWRLLEAGFQPHECAAIRGLDTAEIFDHALRAAQAGLTIDPAKFIARATLDAIAQKIGPETPERIRPLLSQLPPGTRYEEVQLYLDCRRSESASS